MCLADRDQNVPFRTEEADAECHHESAVNPDEPSHMSCSGHKKGCGVVLIHIHFVSR